MVFQNLFNNNYIYINDLLGAGGVKRKEKKRKERKERGKCMGGHCPHTSVDPIMKRFSIVMKFQTGIIFNVVNTSMESDFLSENWIFYCTGRAVFSLNCSLDLFGAFHFAFIYFQKPPWKWVSCWVEIDRHIVFI